MNAIENIVKMVTELKKELEEMPETKEAKPVSREEFTLLLSGISTRGSRAPSAARCVRR